jgi:DNA-binding transcriptional LysR family regulator
MQNRNPLEADIALIVATSQEGSFTRAARKLGIPQPSLTRKVSLLEKALGVRLFDRSSRKIELTKAGRLFVPEAIASLNHAERAWDLAQHQALMEHGPFRLGYSAYIHTALLPFLWRLNSPDTEASAIMLQSASTSEMVSRVLKGELHAAVGVLPVQDEDLWIKTIGQEPFYLCLPKGHKLAHKANVTVKDIHGEMVFWIPRSVHQGFYDVTVKYIRSVGAEPIFREVCGAAHIIELVAYGFGVGLVPRSAIRLARSGVIFKSLSDRFLKVETALFARKDQRTGTLQGFIDDLSFRLQTLKLEMQ